MNFKKILFILQASLLLAFFFSISLASASEVTGNLSSSGVSHATVPSGTTGGGSTVTGTFGGGTSSSGSTIAGTVTGGSGGGGGGGGGGSGSNSFGGSVLGAETSTILASNSTSGSYLTDSAGYDRVLAQANGEDIVLDANAQGLTDQNTDQTAFAGGSSTGGYSWLWWLLGIILLITLGYYLFREKDQKAQ
jgi:hypothetical protein